MEIYRAAREDLLASQRGDPLLRHLTRIVVDLAGRYAPPDTGPVVDVGCGVGRTSLALARAGYRVSGLDPNRRAIALAEEEAASGGLSVRARFRVGDATAAPPGPWEEAFQLAVCSEVLEHVPNPEAVVGFCRGVLRPGGILLLTVPHDPGQWTAMDDYAGHRRRFRALEVAALLGGFEELEAGTEGFPFQRLLMKGYDTALRWRGGEHSFDSYGGSRLYRAYARWWPALLRLDHLFRGLGRGTTLVVVARRRAGAYTKGEETR